MRFLGSLLLFLFSLGFLGAVASVGAAFWVIDYYGRDVPDFSRLKDYQPEVVTRVHGGDGRLMAEFASERRIFVPIGEIPPLVIHAFLAAEDKNFYKHDGIDYAAITRAMITNIQNASTGRRLVGASTITQQVAKNFIVGNERSYERKIKEAIIAYRMEQTFGKDKILELYLNEIFLGGGSYGVASAALYYFNKPLKEVLPHEAAYLAALPKAPNNYHPVRHHDAALVRRNWVLDRMLEDGRLDTLAYKIAREAPLTMVDRGDDNTINAPYFAEEVRRELIDKFGTQSLYSEGLSVRTSLDPALQQVVESALQEGLQVYDRRHGWRGPVARLGDVADRWREALSQVSPPERMLSSWMMAVVLRTEGDDLTIGLSDGQQGTVQPKDHEWLMGGDRSWGDVLAAGDVLMVSAVPDRAGFFAIEQIPVVQGAVVALDPNTGRVLAIQGGWQMSRQASEFNRATQAKRQPGSAFKPFIYLAALENGFTPATRILDAPLTYTDALGRVWSPENYSGEYYGPTTLRVGVEKSRNLMTVRLAETIGMDKVAAITERFGIVDQLPRHLANALGSQETTLLRMTAAYGMIVNGGKKITPSFVDRIQNRHGEQIYTNDQRPCPNCGPRIRWEQQDSPVIPEVSESVASPAACYQMVSILEGVIQRGTAQRLKELPWPMAGKTGTTNESRDAWFVGFTPDLAVGVYVGFDDPKSLGDKETGGSVAVPIFKKIIEGALAGQPPTPFRTPPGLRQVQIIASTGERARGQGGETLWEHFVAGTEPSMGGGAAPVIGGGGTAAGWVGDNALRGSYDPAPDGAAVTVEGEAGQAPPPPLPAPYYAPDPVPSIRVDAPPPPAADTLPQGTGGLY